jgi:V/A-type H+-transporting ATPase subunit C
VKQTTHAAAVARVRVREAKLITKEEFERFSGSWSQEEFVQFVAGKGWNTSKSDDYESVLDEELNATWAFVLELINPKELLGVFLCQHDYHNLKAAIKSCVLDHEFEDVFLPQGLVPCQVIRKAAEQNEFALLPKYMQTAAKEAKKVLLHTGDGQLCDVILDRDELKAINMFGSDSECEFIKNYAELLTAFVDIKIAIRCNKTQKNREFLKKSLFFSNIINIDDILETYRDEKALYSLILKTKLAEGVPFLEESVSSFEEWFNRKIIKATNAQKSNPFTLGPVAGYLLCKLQEIKKIKELLTKLPGKPQKMPKKEQVELRISKNAPKTDENSAKAAVMGDIESIYGFASLGLEIFAVTQDEEATKMLKTLASNGYAIIYITEDLAAGIAKEISKFDESLTPAIVPLPGAAGSCGFARENMKKLMIKAIGSEV